MLFVDNYLISYFNVHASLHTLAFDVATILVFFQSFSQPSTSVFNSDTSSKKKMADISQRSKTFQLNNGQMVLSLGQKCMLTIL